jgi:hypothetical protein
MTLTTTTTRITKMTDFRKYDHLERFKHSDVEGILHGTVYVFPKLDGTNGSVFLDEAGNIACASRNRVLSLESDNAGFCAWVLSADPKAAAIRDLVRTYPHLVVYGEWLVPHTLKTYREDVWRRFWVFDIYDTILHSYLPFGTVSELLRNEIDLIHPLSIYTNPSEGQLRDEADKNTYLVRDGAGAGEGIVLKNYEWRNRYGRQPWAKIVRNEFKEENRKVMGVPGKPGTFNVEAAIAQEFVTQTLVTKTHAKILVDLVNRSGESAAVLDTVEDVKRFTEKFRPQLIPQLLGRVYHDLIVEEMWAILKKYQKSHPTINFRDLQGRVTVRIKELAKDLF